ncbi:hypothetical protein GGR10_001248 [Bartonella chomelii]|uniref:Uncharacterized protein n=1 Tax=Bartonella chomelii TaxID=236402 RepID=A0ABR6E6Y4_9HYPH|nr:hypothetical protein [Bartonella chomelii]
MQNAKQAVVNFYLTVLLGRAGCGNIVRPLLEAIFQESQS